MTAFTYDSSDRVTKVEQRNTSAGSAGTAVTRFSYASDTSTLVADPRSDQSKAVADAARTTYTLDGNDLVTKAVDAANREQSRSYNPANNGVASSTVGTGSSGSTSTNAYDANDGQSLTSSQSASLDPRNANRYAFVGCDPINGSDSTGRVSQCFPAIATTVIGAVGLVGTFTGGLAAVAVAPVTGGASFVAAFGFGTLFATSAAATVYGAGSIASACG